VSVSIIMQTPHLVQLWFEQNNGMLTAAQVSSLSGLTSFIIRIMEQACIDYLVPVLNTDSNVKFLAN
jgi:predicted thioesterase